MPQALAANQQLAGYEIVALVGKGGMGEVYRARQMSMDRVVALKVLALHHSKNDPFTKSFVEEARAAGRLSHPNIVSVHDVGSTTLPGSGEQVYYFSMEFIEGESLKDIIGREGRCPDDLVGVVMSGMAEALTYAEKMGIVHRDIKPDNVMITKDKLVKLADLGLAVRMGGEQIADETNAANPNERSKVMGTPMYMSPEQARAGKIDHRSDQYSLGATLFHLLTGQPPYRGTDARAIMRSHVFDPVPDPRDVREDVPDTWRQLCMRLMAKTPEERFATAADLRAAVYAANHGVALSSFARRAPRMPRRLTRSSRTHQLLAVLAALVVLGGGAALALGGGPGPGGPATPSEHPSPSLPVPNTGGGGDIDLAPLRAQLATLPSDPRAALAALEDLRWKPEWAPTLAKNLLEEAARKYAAQIQAARDYALKQEYDILVARISAGRLAEALGLLTDFQSKHPDAVQSDQFKEVAAMFAKACASLASSYRDRVARAGSGAEIDAVLAEAKGAPLSADDQRSIDGLAAKHRDELANEQDHERRQALARAWQALAADFDQQRRSFRYVGYDDILDRHAKDFPAADATAQKLLAALKDVQQFASVGEVAVKGWVERAHPEVEAIVNDQPARVQLLHWSANEVECRSLEEGDRGGEVRKVPRAQIRLRGTDKILAQALAGVPQASGYQGQVTAVCLWMWRQEGALSAAQALGGADLGQALAELIRGYDGDLGLNGVAIRDHETLTISYDFAGKDGALLRDFEGAALTIGDHGLLWTSNAAVPAPADGVGLEASLPRVAWQGQLAPPLTVDALVWLHPSMALAMVGLESGGRRIRIGISHDRYTPGHVSDRYGLVITSDDGVHYQGSQVNDHDQIGLWDPEKPLHLSLSMQDSGQVAASLNDAAIGSTYVGALPNGPTRVVLQTFQSDGQTVLELSSLTIKGKVVAR